MATDYLLGIFHWRDHAGDLEDPHPSANLRTLLWGCDRWLELNPMAEDTDDGRRLKMIKRELEEYVDRQKNLPPIAPPPPSTLDLGEGSGVPVGLLYWSRP